MLLRHARRRLRWPALLLLVSGIVLLAWQPAAAQTDDPVVQVLQVEGPLDGPVTGHIERSLDDAEDAGVAAVVLELSTLGGLRTDGFELAARIQESTVPVVVWAGPPGARVTGAGAIVAQSAHLLAMAPATVLGAASPPDLADESARADASTLRELATAVGRDGDFAAATADGATAVAAGEGAADLSETLPDDALPWSAVPGEARVLDDEAIVEAGIADFVAAELPDVWGELDRRTVALPSTGGEATIDLNPATAIVRYDNLGLLDRALHAMASPTLVYLLLIGGALAILFEVYQPGFGVAGGAGLLVAALSVYGLWVLPTSWWALALVVVGLALLAVDLAIAGLGLLTASGTAALGAGSYWLFDGPPPLQPPVWVLVVAVAFCVLFFVVIMTTVLRAQGAQAMAGAEQVIGERGVVRSMLNPEGHVFVGGALWRARAPEGVGKVKTGASVKVVGMSEDGLSLAVELADDAEEAVGNPA